MADELNIDAAPEAADDDVIIEEAVSEIAPATQSDEDTDGLVIPDESAA